MTTRDHMLERVPKYGMSRLPSDRSLHTLDGLDELREVALLRRIADLTQERDALQELLLLEYRRRERPKPETEHGR